MISVLYLHLDQALELLSAARNLKEILAVRYCQYNGLSPMEISMGRVEHLDPAACTLFLTRRHWKDNEPADIDPETVNLQLIYNDGRKKGPLILSRNGGHLTRQGIWHIVKQVALRTSIPDAEKICPLVLKRTFARVFLRTPGNTIAGLQKAFSHKHLEATARYLRFTLDDVRREKAQMMMRVEHAKTE